MYIWIVLAAVLTIVAALVLIGRACKAHTLDVMRRLKCCECGLVRFRQAKMEKASEPFPEALSRGGLFRELWRRIYYRHYGYRMFYICKCGITSYPRMSEPPAYKIFPLHTLFLKMNFKCSEFIHEPELMTAVREAEAREEILHVPINAIVAEKERAAMRARSKLVVNLVSNR